MLKTWPHTLAHPNFKLSNEDPTNYYNILAILYSFLVDLEVISMPINE